MANKLPRPPLSTSAAPITSHAPSIEKTTPIPVTSLAAGNAAEQLYKALYDYDSKEPGDLLFKTGDIIQVSTCCILKIYVNENFSKPLHVAVIRFN